MIWTSFVEYWDTGPVRCPRTDPTGGVSGPASSYGPPAGPDEGTSSGGARVDLAHVDPEGVGDLGEGQMAGGVLQVLLPTDVARGNARGPRRIGLRLADTGPKLLDLPSDVFHPSLQAGRLRLVFEGKRLGADRPWLQVFLDGPDSRIIFLLNVRPMEMSDRLEQLIEIHLRVPLAAPGEGAHGRVIQDVLCRPV